MFSEFFIPPVVKTKVTYHFENLTTDDFCTPSSKKSKNPSLNLSSRCKYNSCSTNSITFGDLHCENENIFSFGGKSKSDLLGQKRRKERKNNNAIMKRPKSAIDNIGTEEAQCIANLGSLFSSLSENRNNNNANLKDNMPDHKIIKEDHKKENNEPFCDESLNNKMKFSFLLN